jgi:hypothetical protein
MLAPENIKVMSNGKYRRWAASIGGGNIGYVVFVLSLIVLAVTLAVLGGARGGGLRWLVPCRRHGALGGFVHLLYRQCRIRYRGSHQRPVGSEATDRMRPTDPLHRLSHLFDDALVAR